MKLLFQFLSSQASLPTLLEHVQVHLQSTAAPGTEVEVRGTRNGGRADDYRLFEFLDTYELMSSLSRIESGEVDGVAIANSLDVGLPAARELLPMPVTAYLETNLHVAQMMGDRFVLLVPNPGFVARYRGLVEMYRQEGRCAGVFPLDFHSIPAMDQLFGSELDVELARENIIKLIEEPVELSGADVVIPCGPPALFMSLAGLQEVGDATVIDGFAVLCKVTEALTGLAAGGRHFVARSRIHRTLPAELMKVGRDALLKPLG